MSRAVRRQQVTTPKQRPGKRALGGAGGGRPPTRGAKPVSPKRRFAIGLPRWLDDIISELKKVTWPTWNETTYLTMVVIIVSLTVGAFLGMTDIFFNWLIDRLLLR